MDPVGALVAWHALEFHGGQEATGIRSAFPHFDLFAGSGEHDSGAQPRDAGADHQDWLVRFSAHLPVGSGRNGPREAEEHAWPDPLCVEASYNISKGVQWEFGGRFRG